MYIRIMIVGINMFLKKCVIRHYTSYFGAISISENHKDLSYHTLKIFEFQVDILQQ